ncbi:MAG: hypothetical protein WBD71_17750 [Xanthobacteraceae bacterium]
MTEPADRDAKLRASIPTQEKEQPDPFLQMTTGHMGVGGVTLFAVVAVAILCVVLYGLNEHGFRPTPPAATAQSSAPAAGGHGGAATPTAPQTTNNAKG